MITHHAPQPHECSPGWAPGSNGTLHMVWARPGDIWTCDCGLQWIARKNRYENVMWPEWSPVKIRKKRWWHKS